MKFCRKWRWVVLVACFVSGMLNSTMFYVFGMFVIPWMHEFSKTGAASIATVTSLAAALTSLVCPFGSIFIQKWGYRWAHVIGGFILMLSFALSSFAQSITHLLFSYSVLGGFGGALCLGSFVVAISEHFHDQQGLGFAIATSAYGFGGFIFPLLFEVLIQNYTWRGAMLVMSGLFAHIIPCGLLLYPVDQTPSSCSKGSYNNQYNLEKENKVVSSDENTCEHFPINDDVKGETKNTSGNEEFTSFQLIKLLLRTWSFYIMMLHNIFLFMGYFTVLGLTPMRAKYDLHLSKEQSDQLLSAFGINAIIRLVLGVVAQLKLIRSSVVYLAFFGLSGMLALLSLLANTFELQLIYCLISGALFASLSHYHLLVYEIYGRKLFNVAYGILEIMHGIGIALGPMIGGLLFDVTGTCTYSFVFAGLSIVFAVVILPIGLTFTNDLKKLNF